MVFCFDEDIGCVGVVHHDIDSFSLFPAISTGQLWQIRLALSRYRIKLSSVGRDTPLSSLATASMDTISEDIL